MFSPRKPIVLSLLVVFLACWPADLPADMIGFDGAESARNIAEIRVLDDRVSVALEVYLPDLEVFQLLLPNAYVETGATPRPSYRQRLRDFSEKVLTITTDSGELLYARLNLLEPRMRKDRVSRYAGMVNPYTGLEVPGPPDDKRVLFIELEYPFTDRPGALTITPPLNEFGVPAAPIGFIAYHNSVSVSDYKFLSAPSTMKLDWEDPWYTRFDVSKLNRFHSSPAMAFIYVEPREVRYEILFRLRDLGEWIDLELNGSGVIKGSQWADIKSRSEMFFRARQNVRIDDKAVQPAATRSEMIMATPEGVKVLDRNQDLDLEVALIGVILSFPVDSIPQTVAVNWDMYSDRIRKVPATSIDPVGPFVTIIEPRLSEFKWQNLMLQYREPRVKPVVFDYGRTIEIPLLGLGLLGISVVSLVYLFRTTGSRRLMFAAAALVAPVAALTVGSSGVVKVGNPFAGLPEEPVLASILSDVLDQINIAYLEKKPGALDRALEVTIDKDNFSEVKGELDRALAIRVAGGGIARIQGIENLNLQNVSPADSGQGFQATAEWTANANAGHWGHNHSRRIRFQALLVLTSEATHWKLSEITVLDARDVSG